MDEECLPPVKTLKDVGRRAAPIAGEHKVNLGERYPRFPHNVQTLVSIVARN